jgi:hypothetical protein
MRYTYWHALRTPASPLVLYASFNRYLHLEPLLKRSTDALTRFHSWVLANLLLSCFQWLEDANELAQHDELYSKAKLSQLVELFERGTFGLRLHHGLLRRGISALTRRLTSLAISRTIRPEKCVRIYRGGARVIRLDSFGEGHPSPSEVD